ncbi:beta strand repeat-containing protein [Mycolicibacterium gilvum]|uniref:beta strand repeat-containing protein n=1 Tax=Mycolicibacterium gilvum TaxID=1804 RepID=UPI004045F4C0
MTSASAGLKSVSFSVTDVDGNPSVVPAGTVVTVVGLPVEVPPLVVVTPVATGVAGQPITISPIVIITDVDSDIESATVTITDAADGDVLSWGEVPDGFDVTTGAGSVTFSGAASAAAYQQILQSVRLTSASAGLKSVSFSVTDVDGNPSVVPAGTVVTVVGLPVEVPPLVVVTPVATGVAGQPITISPIVIITDVDSDIESATVTITDAADGDVLSWGEVPDGFDVTTGAGTVTFSGAASAAIYQQLLESVTLTSASAGLKSVSFAVTDVDGNPSVVPAGTVVTVVGLPVEVPPLIVVTPVATGVAGQPITISPIVIITDLDSDIESATVTIADPAEGDVLSWGEIPDDLGVSVGAGSVTFTGAASAQVYQQLLQSVTLTSTAAGLKSVSFSVTDVDGNPSVVPAGTVVTVVGLSVEVPPLVVVSPVATGVAGQPITVTPIVVITDLDSDIESATVTIVDPAEGDVLSWGGLPQGVSTVGFDAESGTVTFTGAASAAIYQQLLQSVTLTSTAPGVKSVSFAVADVDGNPSVVPAGTVVTVVGLSVEVPPLVVVSPVATGVAGQPITISPIVIITDLDSDIESATVSITDPTDGDVLSWGGLPQGVSTVGFDAESGSVTFTGAASAQVYQQILQSVTLMSTGAGLKSVSFVVADVDGNPSVVPAGTVVTVVGLSVEVPPLVVVSPVATGVAGQPITISPIVIITDLDSDIESATVSITDPTDGDVLSWGGLPQGVSTVGFDAESGSVTFTGAASAAIYQQLLQSVRLTSTGAGLKSVSFSVTDADGNPSVVPAGTVVTVVGLPVEVPPLVVVSPVATGVAGQPITITPIVVITDLDSDLESATVAITDPAEGDVLSWDGLPQGVSTVGFDAESGSVTFSGAASAAIYQQLLQSVTLTSTAAGLKSVSFSVTDVDGNPSVVPAGTVVTVVGLPVEVPPLVVVSPVATGVAGQPITVSPIVVITDFGFRHRVGDCVDH